MKKRLSRRDFLKLAGVGTAIAVPSALGYGVFRSAQGEYPVEVSPYVEDLHTAKLDGSVPILLIVSGNSANPFGLYLTEILRAEGINCFHTADLFDVQSGSLKKFDIAILAETPLNASQAEMFEAFVARGGKLVSMKPDERLVSMFGLERIGGSLSDGYIKTESIHPERELEADRQPTPEEQLRRRELQGLMGSFMAALTSEQQSLVRARFEGGLGQAEVAAKMSKSRRWVRNQEVEIRRGLG